MYYRSNTNYKHNLDKTFTRKEIEDYFFSGWKELINTAYEMVSLVNGAEIHGAKRFKGMLRVYVWAPDEMRCNAAEGIAWKIERLSAIVCEKCGEKGIRRKNLKRIYCFCGPCYLDYISQFDDPEKLYWPSKVGRFKESTSEKEE